MIVRAVPHGASPERWNIGADRARARRGRFVSGSVASRPLERHGSYQIHGWMQTCVRTDSRSAAAAVVRVFDGGRTQWAQIDTKGTELIGGAILDAPIFAKEAHDVRRRE